MSVSSDFLLTYSTVGSPCRTVGQMDGQDHCCSMLSTCLALNRWSYVCEELRYWANCLCNKIQGCLGCRLGLSSFVQAECIRLYAQLICWVTFSVPDSQQIVSLPLSILFWYYHSALYHFCSYYFAYLRLGSNVRQVEKMVFASKAQQGGFYLG